jgi:hypothetical protein
MIYRSMVQFSIRNTITRLSTSSVSLRVHPVTNWKVPCHMPCACGCMQLQLYAGVQVYATHGGTRQTSCAGKV